MEKFEVGMEVIIHGWRWAIVEEVFDNGQSAFVVDQEGEDFEISLGDVDHFYEKV